DGFKTIGAKILGRQKGKDKKGGETEFALYTYKSGSTTVYETMLHSEIYGFRFTAPDQQTMKDFLQDFAKYGNAIG
ncbi:MAG: hypothetical protein H7Z37_15910, partial [Pyrinomonadaceae bacterium]|nr:hypothetical protein [Pyrinomonadaceae bacterium]